MSHSHPSPPPRKNLSWAIPPAVALAMLILTNLLDIDFDAQKLFQIQEILPLFFGFVVFVTCFRIRQLTELSQALVAIIAFLVVYSGTKWILPHKENSPPMEQQYFQERKKGQQSVDFDVFQKDAEGFRLYAQLHPCDRSKAAYPSKIDLGQTMREGWNSFSFSFADIDWENIQNDKGCFEIHVFQLTENGEGKLLGTIKIE